MRRGTGLSRTRCVSSITVRSTLSGWRPNGPRTGASKPLARLKPSNRGWFVGIAEPRSTPARVIVSDGGLKEHN